MFAVEKCSSLLEKLPLGESIRLLRANNNRCIRFSSKARKIRKHLMLRLCIQALIHSHVSPFQHRHLSESWQQIRRRPLGSYRARLLLIKLLILSFFRLFLLAFMTQMVLFEKKCMMLKRRHRPGLDTSLSEVEFFLAWRMNV